MPKRNVDESFFTDESISDLSDFEFRLWLGLITQADDYGRWDARPAIIKGRIFPLRVNLTLKSIEDAIATLSTASCIVLYNVDGRPYYQLTNWHEHQRVRNSKPKFPAPAAECSENSQLAATRRNSPQLAATRREPPSPSSPSPAPFLPPSPPTPPVTPYNPPIPNPIIPSPFTTTKNLGDTIIMEDSASVCARLHIDSAWEVSEKARMATAHRLVDWIRKVGLPSAKYNSLYDLVYSSLDMDVSPEEIIDIATGDTGNCFSGDIANAQYNALRKRGLL